MESIKSQVDLQDLESIQFIFCKVYNEKYYQYSINNTDTFHLITRDDLIQFFGQIDKVIVTQVLYLSSRFFPFLYDNTLHQLIELEIISDIEEVSSIYRKQANTELYKKPTNNKIHNEAYHDYFSSSTNRIKDWFSKYKV
jgi:hypothetical protein